MEKSESWSNFKDINHLKPLNLNDLLKNKSENGFQELEPDECMLCAQKFNITDCQKNYLSHLLTAHRLVISDVDQIGDLIKYNIYWQTRLRELKLSDICFEIKTNTAINDKGETETFYLLCDKLPEDRELREKLNIFKLEKAIKQQELERNDQNYQRKCLFCLEIIGNNRSDLLNHMLNDHNFNIGHADNIVYFDEFYKKLQDRMDSFQCLYCEKIFYDRVILKEHMRKKQHKCINSQNKEFDKFYIINYLEYSKVWQDIKSEKDIEEQDDLNNDSNNQVNIEDWNDVVQTYFCLFCDKSFEDEEKILQHMIDGHKFDFKQTFSTNNLSFYCQVKLVNYIRRQSFKNICFICKSQFTERENLVSHLNENDHVKEFPDKELWDQPENYFSIFEDDSLLCLLDDTAYGKDESKVQVIPEQYDIKLNNEILNDLKSLKL